MLEEIINNNKLYAIIIRANFEADGIKFFTPQDYSQQLGYMKRPKSYKIIPHLHKIVKREVHLTQEVLFIKKGKVKVDFYDEEQKYLFSKILSTGDFILLSDGGHGFEMLEETEMIEVKQGPYAGDEDKVHFSKYNEKKG